MLDTQRTATFFYGLFMDPDLLRSKGLDPRDIEACWVDGLRLRIRSRAFLQPDPSSRAHGVVMSLTLAELGHLYDDADFDSYVPEAVLVHLQDGGVVSALCYNNASDIGPPNIEYANCLVAAATKMGLPERFIKSITDSLDSGTPP